MKTYLRSACHGSHNLLEPGKPGRRLPTCDVGLVPEAEREAHPLQAAELHQLFRVDDLEKINVLVASGGGSEAAGGDGPGHSAVEVRVLDHDLERFELLEFNHPIQGVLLSNLLVLSSPDPYAYLVRVEMIKSKSHDLQETCCTLTGSSGWPRRILEGL